MVAQETFSMRFAQTLRGQDSSSFWMRPVVHMLANWHSAGLALFDTEAWGDPEVHASAATEVLAGVLVLFNSCVPVQHTYLTQRPQLNHWQ